MSAATFKVEIKTPPRKDGLFAVRIRITRFRKHAYWNIGRYIEATELNPKPKERLRNWVLKNRNAPQINDAIAAALDGLAEVADKNPALTASEIKQAYERKLNPETEAGEKAVLFWTFATELLRRRSDINYTTGQNMGYALAEFKAIAGERTPFAQLFAPKMLHQYVQALKAKGNSPVTINNKLKDLRTIYNAGVHEKVFPDLGKPFAGTKLTTPKKKRIRPTAAQVRQLLAHSPTNAVQTMAKTVATLQYLLQGARITEALTLQWSNVHESYIEYLPAKDAVRPKFIPRSKLLNQLLSEQNQNTRYVLPFIGEDYHDMPGNKKLYRRRRIMNQVNTGLKEISTALKLPHPITSHQMRHAFADAVIAAGANPHTAAALLGHTNPKTTEIYIKELGLEETSDMALGIFAKLEGEQGEQ